MEETEVREDAKFQALIVATLPTHKDATGVDQKMGNTMTDIGGSGSVVL